MTKGKRLFMQSLLNEGVRYIFGNPGTTEAPLIDTLVDYPQIEYILALHEGVAVGMADAYALAMGKVGVVNLHVAPGLGNGLGMLYDALEGHSPLLVTAGEPDSRMRLREPILSHDLVAMAAPLTKWSVRAERAAELPLLLHRAFKIAKEPPSGPVFVSLPVNVMEEESDAPVFPATHSFANTRADSEALSKAADLLLAARNPVVICGGGVFRFQAQEELAAVVELLGAPVWNTLLTSAVNFPMTHPQFRGELPASHDRIRHRLGNPDAVLLVGGSFFREVFFTPESPWPEDTVVIQIDAAPQALARNFSVTVGLAANPKTALRDLRKIMSSRATDEFLLTSKARNTQQSRLKTQEQQRRAEELREGWDVRPMTLPRFLFELQAGLPPDVVVVGEVNTGRDKLISTLPFQHPGDFYGSRGGGIGQGLPGALGYHLAHPDRPLLAISADGSSLYSIQALWTAAHYHLPVVFVILNNRAYHVLKLNLDLYRSYFELTGKQGYPFMDLTRPDIDFVQLAFGFGVSAQRIVEPEAVGPAVQEAFANGEPYLLDVQISNDRTMLAHAP